MLTVIPIVGREQEALALQALLALSKVKLYANNITPSGVTDIPDFTEATFTGYVAQTVTATGDPYIDPVNGGISITLPSNMFETASPYTVGNTIYGWWLETAAGDLVAVGKFDNPIVMDAAFSGFPLSITLNF